MNCRVLSVVCVLSVALAFGAVWAQGASGAAAGGAAVSNAAADTAAAAKDTAAKKSAAKNLDLDNLLSGDHPEEDLLVDEKPAVKPAAASAGETPKIAVYVTGGNDSSENKILTTLVLDALINSGKYRAIERSNDFVSQIDKEQAKQRSGAVDDNQIRQVGIQAGVQFVCVVNMECAFNSCLISARIIDVETAEVVAISTAESRLGSTDEIKSIANDIVMNMLGIKAPDPKPVVASPATAPAADTSTAKTGITRVTAATDPDALAPLAIEDGRTINFAQNLKEYRSPRIAMLLSLLVPGLGQAYSRSYVKAGAFGAAELAVIGVAAYLNSVGKAKKRDAHNFADRNFDVDRMQEYETRLRETFEARELDITTNPNLPDTSVYRDFYESAKQKGTLYYLSISDMYFTPGWKDSDPNFEDIFSAADTIRGAHGEYVRDQPDMPALFYFIKRVTDEAGRPVNGERVLGYSPNQAEYNSMINQSNSYHDAVNYTLYVLLLNHIASAIDAGFTARAYNAWLLGKESAWNRLSVETQYVFTGSEVSPGLALKVRF